MEIAAEKGKNFVVMAKPAGSACNMRCEYCYYLGTEAAPAGEPVMSHETLEALVRSYIAAAPGPVVSFTWHGGEPTLAGIDFYRAAVALQQRYLPEGWECWNSLQTNGLLLDADWCRFLKEARFDVGVSLDGTAAVHDRYRHDAAGGPTWARTDEAVRLLLAHGVRPDLLCTVTPETAVRGVEVYRALRALDTGWMQFIPIVRRTSGGVTPDSVTPEQYGTFLKDVFSEWVFHDLGRTEVQLFSEMALVLSGRPANLCWMAETCGAALVVEKDGGVYACDHFVRPGYRLGNLREQSLSQLANGAFQTGFGLDKQRKLTAECRACPWLRLCGGGCPKDRFGLSPAGEAGQYWLCPGLRDFFEYAAPKLRRAMALSAAGNGSGEIIEKLRAEERARFRGVSRNDPCPCGSGKKFKSCCLRRVP